MLFFNVVSPVLSSLSFSTIYVKIWQGLLQMEKDPYLEVANMAKLVTDFIRNKVANFLFICHCHVYCNLYDLDRPRSYSLSRNLIVVECIHTHPPVTIQSIGLIFRKLNGTFNLY